MEENKKEDIESTIIYIKEKTIELVDLCEKESEENVSNKVRNHTQDILTRLNRLLDVIMYFFYEVKIREKLNDKEKKKYDRLIYFPVLNSKKNLDMFFSNFSVFNIQKDYPNIFNLIDSIQPYNSVNNEWIKNLRKYSNLGHRKLVQQKKNKRISIILSESIKVSGNANVKFNNCFIRGVPVKNLNIDKGRIIGKIDSRLNPRIETETVYFLEDSNINVIQLCQKSLLEIEQLFKNFNNYM